MSATNHTYMLKSQTYIHPDCLARLNILALDLVLQLSGDQAQHVLATTKETAAGGIVDTRLFG